MFSPETRGCLIVTGMATEKRLRVSFDAESEVVRRAIYIAAALEGKTHNEILNTLVKAHLSDAVKLAEKAIAKGDPPPRTPRKSADPE